MKIEKWLLNGIRVEKSVDGVSTQYLIDPANPTGYAQVLEETTYNLIQTTQAERIQYTLGDDVISQTKSTWNGSAWTANPTQYLLYDGLGSTRQLVNANLSVQDSYSYDGYGVMLSNSNGADAAAGAATSLLYTGEQYDTAAQSYYLRARYYDPMNGRFSQMDTYAGNTSDPQSLHKYTYCHNDPVNYIDPTGHFETMVGAIAAVSIQSITCSIMIGSLIDAKTGGKITAAIGSYLSALFSADTWLLALSTLWGSITEIFTDVGIFVETVVKAILSMLFPIVSWALNLWGTLKTMSSIKDIFSSGLSIQMIGKAFAVITATILILIVIGLVIGAVMDRINISAAKNTGEITVSRYGRDGLQSGDWVMVGKPSGLNYFRSGKWDPTQRIALPSSGREYKIPLSALKAPVGNSLADKGVFGMVKKLWGQKMYIPD